MVLPYAESTSDSGRGIKPVTSPTEDDWLVLAVLPAALKLAGCVVWKAPPGRPVRQAQRVLEPSSSVTEEEALPFPHPALPRGGGRMLFFF